MKRRQEKPEYRPIRIAVWSVVFGILFLIGVAAFSICSWYSTVFDLEFKELLYTLASPLKGTGESTVAQVLNASLPWVCGGAVGFTVCAVLLARRGHVWRILRRIGASLCALVLVSSLVFAVFALRIPSYAKTIVEKTTIYEDRYVDPMSVAITADGKTKNLIYIYLESMETTYASVEAGGRQSEYNYIPALTALAQQGVSFTEKADGLLGGFRSPTGTGWTMAALLSTTSGIPFSFPVKGNAMSAIDRFATGLTTLTANFLLTV